MRTYFPNFKFQESIIFHDKRIILRIKNKTEILKNQLTHHPLPDRLDRPDELTVVVETKTRISSSNTILKEIIVKQDTYACGMLLYYSEQIRISIILFYFHLLKSDPKYIFFFCLCI